MSDTDDLFTIGQVTGIHGLGGNLKVRSFAESADTFSPGKSVLLTSEDDAGQRYTILKATPQRKGILLFLEGIDNRELAEDLVGKKIFIDRAQLTEPEEDTWYWQDLLGLDVFDDRKGFIGKITDIIPTGANDVLVVTDKTRETLVPMHKHFVDSVNIETGIVRTTLPEDY
jgi:16S rRNA processing protein RimM